MCRDGGLRFSMRVSGVGWDERVVYAWKGRAGTTEVRCK